jgi:hypothetical protein
VPPRLLRAYVDETGDRGHSAKSSPFFAFAAVLVGDEDEPAMRAVMSRLRRDLSVPAGKALHWKEHVKKYDRRQHVARQLAGATGVMVIYVIVEKTAIPVGSGIYSDHELFYNYAAAMVMERLLLAAGDWPGGSRDVSVRFGHVKGFRHSTTAHYFRRKAATPDWVPWARLHGTVYFSDQAQWDGLQAADQYAGMLNVAVTADQFGGYEEAHLLAIRHQIRRDPQGRKPRLGFQGVGQRGHVHVRAMVAPGRPVKRSALLLARGASSGTCPEGSGSRPSVFPATCRRAPLPHSNSRVELVNSLSGSDSYQFRRGRTSHAPWVSPASLVQQARVHRWQHRPVLGT